MIIEWNIQLIPSEQVALQFALESDPRRECLNLMRVLSLARHPSRNKSTHWNVLFERKL